MRILGIVTSPPGHRAEGLLTPALGQPLLAYSAQAALGSHRLSRAVLYSDSPMVRTAGEELGLEIGAPLGDPQDLPALRALVSALENEEGRPCDGVMLLPAIHPLRSRDDIDGSIQLLERTGADAVVSLVKRRRTAGEWARIDPEGRIVATGEETGAPERAYLRDGSIRCFRRRLLMEESTLEARDCRAWLLPPERYCPVEDDFDLYVFEHLLRYPGRSAA